MIAALKAGTVYFALVFAVGFVLGTIRVFGLAPLVGESGAVAIELPVMLLASWIICRHIMRALLIARTSQRAVMGALALSLLLMAEFLISVLLLGKSPSEHFAAYREFSTQLGFAAQIAFALFPLMQEH